MDLTPDQLLHLHAEDGLANEADCERMSEAGIDLEASVQLRMQLREALGSVQAPVIAPDVMAQLGIDSLPVAEAIRDEAGRTGLQVDAVMQGIGHPAQALELADAIAGAAGDGPNLWPGIAAAIGAEEQDRGSLLRDAVEAEAGDSGVHWMAQLRPWRLAAGTAGAMLAIAAALLLWVGTAPTMAPEVVAENIHVDLEAPVQIEALEVRDDVFVQVLQFGEDSPTIIFLDEQ